MGWIALTKTGEHYYEDNPNPEYGGRPVAKGEEGSLALIAQEDYGHKVAIDLYSGVIAIDYDSLEVQNGQVGIGSPKMLLFICDETNIVGELMHNEVELVPYLNEVGQKVLGEDGEYVKVRNDNLTPLTWRPIWFTRFTNGIPTKVIGAQTTLPTDFGGKNVKKMISLFADGRVGID